jgi:hypothetical protein
MTQQTLLDSLVWVKLHDPADFLKIKETLTRIGVASRKDKKLFQSCHILHKQGKYAIVHFKELFALDGKDTNFSDEDKARRNTIAALLEEWGLVTLTDAKKVQTPKAPMSQIKVIAFKEKGDWELCSKYSIGRTRKSPDQYTEN